MKIILKDDDFITLFEGKCGTHSIRQMETLRDRRCGCSKYETDTRYLWKQRCHKDLYDDMIIPWTDEEVVTNICKGVTSHYQVRLYSGISEDCIFTFVVSTISSKYCRSVSLVLGRSLLWRIFDEVQHFDVQENIWRRVQNDYQDLGDSCRITDEDNLVEKVLLIVTGSYAEVHIDVLLEDYGMEDDGNLTGRGDVRLLRPHRVDSEQL